MRRSWFSIFLALALTSQTGWWARARAAEPCRRELCPAVAASTADPMGHPVCRAGHDTFYDATVYGDESGYGDEQASDGTGEATEQPATISAEPEHCTYGCRGAGRGWFEPLESGEEQLAGEQTEVLDPVAPVVDTLEVSPTWDGYEDYLQGYYDDDFYLNGEVGDNSLSAAESRPECGDEYVEEPWAYYDSLGVLPAVVAAPQPPVEEWDEPVLVAAADLDDSGFWDDSPLYGEEAAPAALASDGQAGDGQAGDEWVGDAWGDVDQFGDDAATDAVVDEVLDEEFAGPDFYKYGDEPVHRGEVFVDELAGDEWSGDDDESLILKPIDGLGEEGLKDGVLGSDDFPFAAEAAELLETIEADVDEAPLDDEGAFEGAGEASEYDWIEADEASPGADEVAPPVDPSEFAPEGELFETDSISSGDSDLAEAGDDVVSPVDDSDYWNDYSDYREGYYGDEGASRFEMQEEYAPYDATIASPYAREVVYPLNESLRASWRAWSSRAMWARNATDAARRHFESALQAWWDEAMQSLSAPAPADPLDDAAWTDDWDCGL